MERQGVNLKIETIEINQFIKDFCTDFQSLANQHQVSINCHLLPQTLAYPLDCHWFYQALQNLLSNAIQYAESKVIITLSKTVDSLEIQIEDDGKGIDKNKQKQIFDPFVKLDADRSREQGHFGLGLAICQKVVHWHKGRITASNSKKLPGACFNLSLPL